MPRGRAGGRLGGGRRAGHGLGAHHRAAHGFGGHGFGGHGIGRSHFHNQHFHHHGNHLFNSRPRHHGGHLSHGVPTNLAIHMGTDENGINTVTVSRDRTNGVSGSHPRQSQAALITILLFVVLGSMCFLIGSLFLGLGSWTNSGLGIVGIALMILGAIFGGLLILSVFCLAIHRQNPAAPGGQAGEDRADEPNPNLAEPSTTAQGGVTDPSQGVETTSFVIQTNTGGVAMPPQTLRFNITPEFAAGAAQSFQELLQNFSAAPNAPSGPGETLPYPPPQSNPTTTGPMPNPGATAPPFNYPVAYPPLPAEGKADVVEPAPEDLDDIPPPPSYDDAVTRYGKK